MIFLDGVPVENISQIISLGTEKINKIEVIPTQRYSGNLCFSGILAVFTKRMEINNIMAEAHAVRKICITPYGKSQRLSL
jgi:hypothetical protein